MSLRRRVRSMAPRAPRAMATIKSRGIGGNESQDFVCVPIVTRDAVGRDERVAAELGDDDASKHEVRCVFGEGGGATRAMTRATARNGRRLTNILYG